MCTVLRRIFLLLLICGVVEPKPLAKAQFDSWRSYTVSEKKYFPYESIVATTTSAPINGFGSYWYNSYMKKYNIDDSGNTAFSGVGSGTKYLDEHYPEYTKYNRYDDELSKVSQTNEKIGADWSGDQKKDEWNEYDVPMRSDLYASSSDNNGHIYFYEVLVSGFFILAVVAIFGRCIVLYCRGQNRGLLYIRDTAIIVAGRRPRSNSKEILMGNDGENADDPPPGYTQCVPGVHSFASAAAASQDDERK